MSEYSVFELLVFQLFLILINAVFACAEIAVISFNDNKLQKLADEGNASAQRLVYLTKQPANFLATIQVGITLAGFLGSAFAADNFSDRVVKWLIEHGATMSYDKLDVLAVLSITLILSYITLILGELVPKRIAMQYAEKIALLLSWPILIIAKIFAPIVWFLTKSTNLVLRGCGINPDEKNDNVSEEEIRMMIDVGSQKGSIDNDEKQMLHKVFEFDDKIIRNVMTHRTKVCSLNMDDSKEIWEKIMVNSRYSIYPLCQDDNIVGTISVKDYFKNRQATKSEIIKKAVRPVWFVADISKINLVFKEMQRKYNHFAVVIDEYGTIKGIVTMTDLLEELVGNLADDEQELKNLVGIEACGVNTWKMQGITPIETVASTLKINIPQGNYSTLAGFILSLMVDIDLNQKNISLQYEKQIEIKISKIKQGKIIEAIISKL